MKEHQHEHEHEHEHEEENEGESSEMVDVFTLENEQGEEIDFVAVDAREIDGLTYQMLMEVQVAEDGSIVEKEDEAAIIFVTDKEGELWCVEDPDQIERIAAEFGLDEEDDDLDDEDEDDEDDEDDDDEEDDEEEE